MSITISQEQYEALIALARRGAVEPDGSLNQDQALVLDAFLRDIEKSNGIVRYALWIRWQDPTTPLIPTTNFPKTWPPNQQYFLQFISRPITQPDVMKVVTARTPNAINIMVTKDPAALLGWTKLSDYFIQP